MTCNVDESILEENSLIEASKMRAISFDPVRNAYLVLGERVGNIFSDGGALK